MLGNNQVQKEQHILKEAREFLDFTCIFASNPTWPAWSIFSEPAMSTSISLPPTVGTSRIIYAYWNRCWFIQLAENLRQVTLKIKDAKNHTMQWLRELLSLQRVLLTILLFSTFWISFEIFPASLPDMKVAFLAFFPITSSFTCKYRSQQNFLRWWW